MMLSSKYPIVAAAMNRVSDIKLAIACHNAGITPSLSFMNYVKDDGTIKYDHFRKDLTEFVNRTNSNNVIVSIIVEILLVSEVTEILNSVNIKNIEIIDAYQSSLELISLLKEQHKFNYIVKMSEPNDRIIQLFDGIMLKGKKGAGAVNLTLSDLENEVKKIKLKYPNKFLIASGGIGNSKDIQKLLNAGADAVGVGTLYAVSEESSIGKKAKLKILEASSNDIQPFGPLTQNSLLFKKVDLVDDINNTKSLEIGIKSGFAGHIFVGHGIDHVDRIKTVDEITKELIKDLKNVY